MRILYTLVLLNDLSTYNLHPKGVRRARAVLGDSETQDP